MFFYFAWGKEASKNYGTAVMGRCSNCNCESEWSLFVRRKLGMLMVIPFFYDHKYFLICNKCNNYFEIYGKQVETAKKMNKALKKYNRGKLTKEEITKEIHDAESISDIEEPDTTWECPSCNSINPNTTYRCRDCGYKLI